MTSPTLCQPRGTLPENTGKGGMKFKRESFPWGDLDLQNLSHKTTLESPNPGPLRLQQTLESPEAFNKIPIPGPCYSEAPLQSGAQELGICSFICTEVLEELAESSSGRFIQLLEDLFEFGQLPFIPQINKITRRN